MLANNAIQACVSRFDFRSVHVFTDAPQYWPQYQTHSIEKIAAIEDYNRIVLETLPQFLEDDFCLVIQFDGFILNADAFSDTFYQYDYIGAEWPDYPYFRVGNGGFSWRSRKLINAVAELASIRKPGEPEDLFICRTLRVLLEERYGCKFAPEEVARRFSYEIVPESQPAFGFHGIFNLPMVYRNDPQFLVKNLPARILSSRNAHLQYGINLLDLPVRQVFQRLLADAVKIDASQALPEKP